MFFQAKQTYFRLKYLRNKNFRKLPLKTLLAIRDFTKDEKATIFDGAVDINQTIARYPSAYLDQGVNITRGYAEGRWSPIALFLSVTDRCPCRCEYCYNSLNNDYSQELTLPEIKEIINTLKKHEPNLYQFCITGGEPTLRSDIVEIVETASKDYFTFLNTSGFGFTEELARELKAANLDSLKVSLDYHRPEFVNQRRGHPRAFETAVKAIRIAVKTGFYTMVGCVASREILDKNNFLHFVSFLDDLGVHNLKLYILKHSGRYYNQEGFSKEDEAILYSYHALINKNRKFKIKINNGVFYEAPENLGCVGGSAQIYINSDGTIKTCPFFNLTVGDIHEEKLEVILDRMRKFFGRPKRYCITEYVARQYKKELEELLVTQNMDKKIELFEKLPKTELPGAFKKLLSKKDDIISRN
jgi:MoaA/NifB/PqqE/SkfB family radical SAM enzyme